MTPSNLGAVAGPSWWLEIADGSNHRVLTCKQFKMKPRSLRIFNACVALLQAITGIAIFIISDRNAKLPWYTDFVGNYSPGGSSSALFYFPIAKKVANLPVSCS